MNSESSSYSLVVVKSLQQAFQQEAKKYSQQISNETRSKLPSLSSEQKENAIGYWNMSGFDQQTKDNCYKEYFFQERIYLITSQIADKYHNEHLKENYTSNDIFDEVAQAFSREITYQTHQVQSFQALSNLNDLGYDNYEDIGTKEYRSWKSKLDLHLFSEALRIINEVRKQVDNKQ